MTEYSIQLLIHGSFYSVIHILIILRGIVFNNNSLSWLCYNNCVMYIWSGKLGTKYWFMHNYNYVRDTETNWQRQRYRALQLHQNFSLHRCIVLLGRIAMQSTRYGLVLQM